MFLLDSSRKKMTKKKKKKDSKIRNCNDYVLLSCVDFVNGTEDKHKLICACKFN